MFNQGKARESEWEFQGNLGLNFDLCRESMASVSGNTVIGTDIVNQHGKFGIHSYKRCRELRPSGRWCPIIDCLLYLASTWLSKQLWVFDSPVLVNQDSYFVVKCISEF